MRRRFVEARWDQRALSLRSLFALSPSPSRDAPFLSLSLSFPPPGTIPTVLLSYPPSSLSSIPPLFSFARRCRSTRGASSASQVLPARCASNTLPPSIPPFFRPRELQKLGAGIKPIRRI